MNTVRIRFDHCLCFSILLLLLLTSVNALCTKVNWHSVLLPPKELDQCPTDCPWMDAYFRLSERLVSLEHMLQDYADKTEHMKSASVDQPYVPTEMSELLGHLLQRLDNMTEAHTKLESKMRSVSSRLFSDEVLGLLIFLFVLSEVVNRIRPHANNWVNVGKEFIQVYLSERKQKTEPVPDEVEVPSTPVLEETIAPCNLTPIEEEPTTPTEFKDESPKEEAKPERKDKNVNFVMPLTPKHGVLKNEMCVVLFRRQNINIYASVVETLLGYVTDIKIANAPFYVIDSGSDVSKIPHVKLFLIICDCNNDYTNGTSRDLRLETIRVMHRLGASVVVIIGNDSESTILTGHGQYNGNLRFIFSNEVMQDLASNGRVFSINREMSPHQMSHLRKMVKMIMNRDQKPLNNKPRYVTLTRW